MTSNTPEQEHNNIGNTDANRVTNNVVGVLFSAVAAGVLTQQVFYPQGPSPEAALKTATPEQLVLHTDHKYIRAFTCPEKTLGGATNRSMTLYPSGDGNFSTEYSSTIVERQRVLSALRTKRCSAHLAFD